MATKRKDANPDSNLGELAAELGDLADRMAAGCQRLQREHGATEPGAKALQRAEGAVRHAAEVLGTDTEAIEAALAATSTQTQGTAQE